MHLALVYKCPNCGNKSKVVAESEDWAKRQAEFQHDEAIQASAHESNLRGEQIELDVIESADDLIALWSSFKKPPIREEVMNACGCATCTRRLYA